MNIINLKRKMTQYYLDWGAVLALFKEIQAFGWLNFVTSADFLWLVFLKIQQPNKCRMARTPFLAKNLSIFFSVFLQ